MHSRLFSQDQEKGYLALLERMLAEEPGEAADLHIPLDSGRNSHNSQNSGESFASSAARSTSINLDARSDISEATTVSIKQVSVTYGQIHG